MFATAGSPETVGVGHAGRAVGVPVAALAEAPLLEGGPEASFNLLAVRHGGGEGGALVHALGTTVAGFAVGGVGGARGGGEVLEGAVGNTRGSSPDAGT